MKKIIRILGLLVTCTPLFAFANNIAPVMVANANTITEPAVIATPTPPTTCPSGFYYDSYFGECHANPTTTVSPTPIPTPKVTIQHSSSNIIIATVKSVDITADNIEKDYGFVVSTLVDAPTQIVIDGNQVDIAGGSTVIVSPEDTESSLVRGTDELMLISGNIGATINNCGFFSMDAVLANLTIPCPSVARTTTSTNGAIFSVSYNQTAQQGTLVVKVDSGQVQVVERSGNIQTVVAGNEIILQSIIPKSSWVLPITNDKIYGGENNMFVWTAYEGAAGYILEYNLPKPSVFAEENASKVEYETTSIVLRPTDYDSYENMVMMNVFIGKVEAKEVVEGRIFPIDAEGNIISASISSDRVTVLWE